MISVSTGNSSQIGGLQIVPYGENNIQPLLGLLNQEFPNWPSNRIKSYMDLVTSKKNDVAGILVAKNESEYYVGLLIYTFQQIKDYKIGNSTNGKKDRIANIFVVENLIASSLILQNKVFLSLVDEGIKIGKDNSCYYIELPKFDDESYDDALICFEQALSIEPANPDLWNLKGIALRSLGRYDEALDCYNKSLDIDPRDNASS